MIALSHIDRWACSASRWLAAGAVLLSATNAGAQERALLRGRIVDNAGAPVPHTNVIVSRLNRIVADDSGQFTASLPLGRATIQVRRLGYAPVVHDLMVERDMSTLIVLNALPERLEGVTVTAARNDPLQRTGFYDRVKDREKGLNNGWFLTPEEIDERRAQRTTQHLERIPGIRLAWSGALRGLIPVASNDCALTIYLDGARLQTARTRIIPHMRPPTREDLLDNIVGANSVAAIEVYPRGSMAPAQYQLLNGTCGIIAIWTKG